MPICLPFSKLMAQATSLTRTSRLAEAVQAIQRAFHAHSSDHAPVNKTTPGADVLEGLVREVDAPSVRPTQTPVPTYAPEAPETPARFEEQSLATEQGMRQYKLYSPAGLADDTPAPLVVMLHGCKQNPDDFAAGTRMNELAQAQGFRVLYPAQAPRSNAHRCWNWFQPADQKRGSGEPALLAAIVREVMQSHAVDTQRVYIAGLSAGGAMAAIMANEYPDLFAAVGVHSGLPQGAAHDVATALSAMQNGTRANVSRAAQLVPTIVFHGDHDTVVSPRNGELLMADWNTPASSTEGSANGLDYVRSVYVNDAGRTVAEHWLVSGAAHAWSGGNPEGSYTDQRGPDATREMLRFFETHQRP